MNCKTVSQLCIGSGLLLSLMSSPARAQEEKGFYTSINLGTGSYSDVTPPGAATMPYEYGFSYQGGIGYDFGRLRTEVNYTHTTSENTTLSSPIKLGTWMLNALVDFPIENSKFEPFVGLGYGTTNADATSQCSAGGADTCTDNVGTWGVSIGAGYEVSETVDLTGTLSYLGFNTIDITDDGVLTQVLDSETLAFRIGARFKF